MMLQNLRVLPARQVRYPPAHGASRPPVCNQLPGASNQMVVPVESSTGHRGPLHPTHCTCRDVQGLQHCTYASAGILRAVMMCRVATSTPPRATLGLGLHQPQGMPSMRWRLTAEHRAGGKTGWSRAPAAMARASTQRCQLLTQCRYQASPFALHRTCEPHLCRPAWPAYTAGLCYSLMHRCHSYLPLQSGNEHLRAIVFLHGVVTLYLCAERRDSAGVGR